MTKKLLLILMVLTLLAPVQAALLPINDELTAYAETVQSTLAAAGLRTEVDRRTESLNRKVRDAQMNRRKDQNCPLAPDPRHEQEGCGHRPQGDAHEKGSKKSRVGFAGRLG